MPISVLCYTENKTALSNNGIVAHPHEIRATMHCRITSVSTERCNPMKILESFAKIVAFRYLLGVSLVFGRR